MLEALALGLALFACSAPETTRVGTLRDPLPKLDAEVSALSPDGARLAIAAPPNRVLVLDLPSGEVGAELDTGRGWPDCVVWRPDGAEVGVLDRHGIVSVFDAGRGVARLRIHTGSTKDSSGFGLRAVAYAAGGSVVVSALGTPAELFDAATGARIARLAPSDGTLVTALDVSADGELVALGDEDGRVAVWRARTGVATGQTIQVPRGDELWGIHSLNFHPDGTRLAIGGGDSRARVWNLADAEPVREYSHGDDDIFGGLAIGHVAFSPDGRRLATTSFTWWATRVWDVESGRRVAGYEYDFGNPCPRTATFTPDGQLVVAELGGAVVDLATSRVRHVVEPQPASQRAAFYRSARGLAWTERAGLLRVCDVASGTVVLERATRWSARQD